MSQSVPHIPRAMVTGEVYFVTVKRRALFNQSVATNCQSQRFNPLIFFTISHVGYAFGLAKERRLGQAHVNVNGPLVPYAMDRSPTLLQMPPTLPQSPVAAQISYSCHPPSTKDAEA